MSYRQECFVCFKPKVHCFCHRVRPFNSSPEFLILTHKQETKKQITTGRMTHLCLKNSTQLIGIDFSQSRAFHHVLDNNHCVVLFPNHQAINISSVNCKQNSNVFPADQNTVIIVLDGTWKTANSLMRCNPRLQKLTKISFTPRQPSRFKIRLQPEKHCLSTIEAVYETLNILAPQQNSCHKNLLEVFDFMIDSHIVKMAEHQANHPAINYKETST